MILAEKHLLNTKQNDERYEVSVKEEIRFAFNTGFKDSFALFQKLPNLVTDFKRAFINLEKNLNIEIEQDTSKLLYRKVVKYMSNSLILFVRYDSIQTADKTWRVILFDQSTSSEEYFVFNTSHILTKDELNQLNIKNEKAMKELVIKVVDKRLKIKMIDDK